jgi:hypothetical protein
MLTRLCPTLKITPRMYNLASPALSFSVVQDTDNGYRVWKFIIFSLCIYHNYDSAMLQHDARSVREKMLIFRYAERCRMRMYTTINQGCRLLWGGGAVYAACPPVSCLKWRMPTSRKWEQGRMFTLIFVIGRPYTHLYLLLFFFLAIHHCN